MGKILSLKHQTGSGNDNWKENPPKYHFSQRTILSLAEFITETDINGIVAQVDIDVYTGFLFHGKPRRPVKTGTPNIIKPQGANNFANNLTPPTKRLFYHFAGFTAGRMKNLTPMGQKLQN